MQPDLNSIINILNNNCNIHYNQMIKANYNIKMYKQSIPTCSFCEYSHIVKIYEQQILWQHQYDNAKNQYLQNKLLLNKLLNI